MNKGFTLIELLAVIVILAVIATITTISVGTTLKNSKNSLSKTQQNNIESAAEAYYIAEGMSKGIKCINISGLINKGYIESKQVLDPKTKKPMEGSVKITYESNQYSYEYKEDECPIVAATAQTKTLAGTVPTGNYEPGDEYIINVDGQHKYHFYVLGVEEDKVNLIMSRNICSDGTLATAENKCTVAWLSKADYNDDENYGSDGNNNKGPITVMNYLYEATKNWSNIENIQMNYTDEENTGSYGYGGITTTGSTTVITMKDGTETATYENLKARLITMAEATETGCTASDGSCPAWMMNGLKVSDYYPEGTKEDISGFDSYWGLSSLLSGSFAARAVRSYGATGVRSIGDASIGVRPVITVSKSELQ